MTWLNLKCKKCHEEVEVYCDGNNATMCPECRSVDEFTDPEDGLDLEIDEFIVGAV